MFIYLVVGLWVGSVVIVTSVYLVARLLWNSHHDHIKRSISYYERQSDNCDKGEAEARQESYQYFARPTVDNQQELARQHDDSPASWLRDDRRVVKLKFFVASKSSAKAKGKKPEAVGNTSYRVVIERTIYALRPQKSAFPEEQTTEPSYATSANSTDRELLAATIRYIETPLFEHFWTATTDRWITPNYATPDSLAAGIGEIKKQLHNLALGRPINCAGSSLDLEPATNEILAGIGIYLPLPLDSTFNNFKRIIQVIGIVVGASTGNPILMNACLKSFVHDWLYQNIFEILHNILLENKLNPDRVLPVINNASTYQEPNPPDPPVPVPPDPHSSRIPQPPQMQYRNSPDTEVPPTTYRKTRSSSQHNRNTISSPENADPALPGDPSPPGRLPRAVAPVGSPTTTAPDPTGPPIPTGSPTAPRSPRRVAHHASAQSDGTSQPHRTPQPASGRPPRRPTPPDRPAPPDHPPGPADHPVEPSTGPRSPAREDAMPSPSTVGRLPDPAAPVRPPIGPRSPAREDAMPSPSTVGRLPDPAAPVRPPTTAPNGPPSPTGPPTGLRSPPSGRLARHPIRPDRQVPPNRLLGLPASPGRLPGLEGHRIVHRARLRSLGREDAEGLPGSRCSHGDREAGR